MALVKRITVNVTARDIKRGVRSSAARCPIAVAMTRRLESELGDIRIFGDYARLPGSCVDLPYECAVFVTAFDLRKPVRPFRFTLEIPE